MLGFVGLRLLVDFGCLICADVLDLVFDCWIVVCSVLFLLVVVLWWIGLFSTLVVFWIFVVKFWMLVILCGIV